MVIRRGKSDLEGIQSVPDYIISEEYKMSKKNLGDKSEKTITCPMSGSPVGVMIVYWGLKR